MGLNDELVLAIDHVLRDHRNHDELARGLDCDEWPHNALAHGKVAHDEVINGGLDFHGALARDGQCHVHHGHGYRGEQAHGLQLYQDHGSHAWLHDGLMTHGGRHG